MDKKTPKSTPEKLREYRKNRNLSQHQIAMALGIDRSTYTNYELHRTPAIDKLEKIAKILKVDIVDLLPDEDAPLSVKDSDNTTTQIYSLSSDEQNLILKFRLLSQDKQAEVLANITKNND